MKKTRLLLLLIAIVFFPLYSGYAHASEDNNKSDYQKWQESKIFRDMFGLYNDDEFVRTVVKDHNEPNPFGVSLTDAEIKELEARFQYQETHKSKLLDYLHSLDSFAWVYIDQSKGGELVVGLKGENYKDEALIARSKELYGLADMVKIRKATYSEKELIDLSNSIFNDREKLKQAGVAVKKTAVNTPQEKVEVYMNPNNKETQALMESIYPKAMMVFYDAENDIKLSARTDAKTPLEGGLMITKSATSTTGFCSSGFIARNGTTNYLVTAGHCTQTDDVIYQGGRFIGITAGSHQGGNNDSAVVNIPSSLASKYVYGDSSQSVVLTSYESANSGIVGDPVCLAGANSGYTCGVVKNLVVNDNIGTHDYYGVRSATYASGGGDSGGTVFAGSVLKGVHFGSAGGAPGVPITSYYSKAADIISQWGLTF